MKANLTFDRPSEIEATIAFTLSVEQWKQIDTALSGAPAYGATGYVREAISDLLRRACVKLNHEPEPRP